MYWKVLKVEFFLGFSGFGVGGSGPVVFLPLVNSFLHLLVKFSSENIFPLDQGVRKMMFYCKFGLCGELCSPLLIVCVGSIQRIMCVAIVKCALSWLGAHLCVDV